MRKSLIIPIHSVYQLITASVSFLWAIHFKDIGLSGLQIGTIFALSTITGILFILPGGLINDRIKSKNLISLGILLVIMGYLVVSWSIDFWTIALMFVLFGFAGNLYRISADSIFLKTIGRNKAAKIGMFLSMPAIGMGMGMIASGKLLETMDFGPLLKILVLGFGVIFLLSFLLPNTKISSPKVIEYREDLLRKEVLFFILMIFLFSIHYGAESTSYGLFLKNNLNLTFPQIGLYTGTAVMSMAITYIIVSEKIKKRRNLKHILYVGLLGSGAGHILSACGDIYVSYFGRIIHETGDAAIFVFLYYGISKFFPAKRLGGHAGTIALVQMAAGFLGALAFGPLGAKFGYHVPIIVSGIISVLAFFAAVYQRHLIKHA